MVRLNRIHHIAIICSDYQVSKKFYTEVMGLTVLRENYRNERNSHKVDLQLGEDYILELFSFPGTPPRMTHPEACGLRHLAFEVTDLAQAVSDLSMKGIVTEPIRIDPYTKKRFTFFADPDQLPIELYEQ